MPREKVPYPCECGECGTSQKLKTINGSGPNSEGNISILGGEGVAVKTDTESHTVTVDVDTDSIVDVKHAENADTAAEAVHAAAADTADEAVHASTADDATYAKYDAAGKTIMNTDGTQTVTGAKTFAGETTVTGKTGISGAVNVTGAVNANNVQNVIKVASHNSVLTSEDVLNAADIMTVNGSANNLLHRSGDEATSGSLQVRKLKVSDSNPWLEMIDTGLERGVNPTSRRRSQIRLTDKNSSLLLARCQIESMTNGSRIINLESYDNSGKYYGVLALETTTTGTVNLILRLINNETSATLKSSIIATLNL